jgi:hypothetical protein
MSLASLKNKILFIPGLLLWVAIIVFSLWLSHNAILYFTHGGEYGILPEKELARTDWLWNTSFYIHLPAGILCLILPWYSFARRVFRLEKGHRVIGKLYHAITLFIVCPTGIYLAVYAKGGLATQVGFVLQGILLGWFTHSAVKAIRKGDTAVHVDHMIRSYAVATVVLTFRILHILFFFLDIPYKQNYAMSQWLGLSANLLIAELIIFALYQHKISNTLKIKTL